MTTTITYRELLRMRIWHSYYLNGTPGRKKDNDFSSWLDIPFDDLSEPAKTALQSDYDIRQVMDISPAPDTRMLLKRFNVIFRPYSQGFFLGCRVEEGDNADGQTTSYLVPSIPYRDAFALRFYLKLNDPEFLRITGTPPATDNAQIYYFSNQHLPQPAAGDLLYLSQPVPLFDPAAAYRTGDLVRSEGELFEALEQNGGAALDQAKIWRRIPVRPYVTGFDRVSVFPSSFTLRPEDLGEVDASALHRVEVQLRRDDEPVAGINPVVATTDDAVNNPLRQVDIRFETPARRPPAPGRYELRISLRDKPGNVIIPDQDQIIYLDDQLAAKGGFGIIELFHYPDDRLGAFRFLKAENPGDKNPASVLADPRPEYRLWWKNRASIWRYHPVATAKAGEGGMTITGLTPLETAEPVPLTLANRLLGLTDSSGDTIVPGPDISDEDNFQALPNPVPGSALPKNGRWFSDLYFHQTKS